jgi:hypothetical protein
MTMTAADAEAERTGLAPAGMLAAAETVLAATADD